MAILRGQRSLVGGALYETGVVDEGERDELLSVVDRKIRSLEATGGHGGVEIKGIGQGWTRG